MTIHRFHVAGAAPGVMALPEAACGHVTRVLRLKAGDALRVFDAGSEFAATIATIEKRRVLVEVGARTAGLPERRVDLHLLMSPLKGDLTEFVLQKATELGVARISPVVFERTDTVARREPDDNRFGRWHRVATSASEQSGRCVVPRIDHVVPLKDMIAGLKPGDAGQLRIVAAEPSLDLAAAASEQPAEIRSIVVAVGPAGGLAPADLTILSEAGFIAERLALHTLRSETACIAALAILGHRFK